MTSITPATPGTSAPVQQPGSLRDAPQAGPIDPSSFREMLAFIAPKSEEMKWASIPWQTDLWEARKLAAEAEKPIFAWMMNGNPLGCV